jgi:hypothetical protein
MSFDDSLLLDGSEPEPWDEESAPFGLCIWCESPLVGEDDCAACAPRRDLDDSPVRASFTVDADGRVSRCG